MSLVIRLMTTPAFSSVKKSRERRCRWRKTVIRRSFMTQEARRPVTRAWPHWAVPETAIDSQVQDGHQDHEAEVVVGRRQAVVDGV